MGCGVVLLGSIIGFVFLGPIGGFLGAFIAFMLGNYNSSNTRSTGRNSSAQLKFYRNLYGMFAKLAQADGPVSRQEINIIDRFTDQELNLPQDLKKQVIKFFDQAKREDILFDTYASNFYKLANRQPQVLVRVIEIMQQVANADGGIDSRQAELLEKAVNIFGLNRYYNGSYSNQQRHQTDEKNKVTEGKDPYEILGCSPEDSTSEIKKKYRKLVKDYHPDRIISKDLPDEFVELANKRFKEIQDAYEKIMEYRGVS